MRSPTTLTTPISCSTGKIYGRSPGDGPLVLDPGNPMPKILVVDDNAINRNLLRRWLVRRGYEVVEAPDGAAGVAAAQAEQPDVILMDLQMPVLDGWVATRQIRASPVTQAIPVIAVTASPPDEVSAHCRAVGCSGVIPKSVDFAALRAQIERVLPV